jgi:Mrp family chromosome partitioning ATPase
MPVNPAELMASPRLEQALAVLRDRFTHVVFDSPPLIGVSDAMILGPRLDGVVIVLRRGRARRDAARLATRLLTSVRARVLGVILNDADVREAGYYGYGYGSDSDSGGTRGRS